MDFEIDWISWFGMLFGPTLLLVSSLEITDSISWGVVGFIRNDLELGDFRYDWNDLLPENLRFLSILSATLA